MRGVAVAVVVGSFAGGLVFGAALAKPIAEPLVVRTYNTFGVEASAMTTSRDAAGGILKSAGIDIQWRDCHVVGRPWGGSVVACETPLGAREVIVQIVSAQPQNVADSLGESLIDVRQQSGVLATVYTDRVELTAAVVRLDAGGLLGRTIAHELGHLLLGTVGHSSHGLMRPHWCLEELKRDRKADWLLSGGQAGLMRRQLVARATRETDNDRHGE